MNYGLQEELRRFTDFILGQSKMPYVPYLEDGDWTNYLPKYEPQAENYETNGCTVWGTQNQIETLHNFLYKREPNYSERFTYLLVPIDPTHGSDPQRVYDSLRKVGLIDNALLPVPDTKEEFLDTSKITDEMYREGKVWLSKYELQHEWLWSHRPDNAVEVMKEALQTSPLGVSVTAWIQQDGKYIDMGQRNNHWCICYKIDDEGIHVFDSYNHSKKVLSLDHNIARAKRIWLNKKTTSSMRRHVSLLRGVVNRLSSLVAMRPSLLQVCEEWLGRDASPSDIAPDELGCAETVTTLLKKVYPETPIITGTWTLWDYLRHPENGWTEIKVPVPGCVVISPTVPGKPFPGHAGIVMDDNVIASNDSKNGTFRKNYTIDTWKKRYVEKGGYQQLYYKRN